MPITAGRITKKSIKSKAQDMLYGRLPLEHGFLLSLLGNHSKSEEKVGCGLARFYLGRSPHEQYNQPCFWFERVDGSHGYFSYLHALKGTSTSKLDDVLKGMRAAVCGQMSLFARLSSATVCALSGVLLAGRETHVDHVIPFCLLAESFIRDACLDVETLEISISNGFPCWIRDEAVRSVWQDFHLEHAQLQMVTAEANMAKGARS